MAGLILEEFKRREELSNKKDCLEKRLVVLAVEIEKRANDYLKRVVETLPEFDLHDASHSLKVLSNIEQLLGKDNIKNLSAYDLFIIYCSAYLHDCGMAPPNWEIELLKRTEGNDSITLTNEIHNDLKTSFTYTEAYKYIKDNSFTIYKDFNEIRNWMFTPEKEQRLQEHLAELFKSYQEFRNGYTNEIKKIKKESEYEKLNNEIRTEFIRINHHIRIEEYVKNMSALFESKLDSMFNRKLLNDLALVCRSHGEDFSFIEKIDTETRYYGHGIANLQFCSMMLRLGDIIHFSIDRAPLVLRGSRIFDSKYSFRQWDIKSQAVNYHIDSGEIFFNAFFETPPYFFQLHEYVDWIDTEIQNHFRLSRQWDDNYNVQLAEKVNREGIKNDEDIFQPQIGLKFTLNQKSIIELLMGVQLYKDKYASLRELYQNSLDACRCMLTESNQIKGEIIFGLEIIENQKYLYCQDNGIGMSKYIIENHLLKIGNSYYKSPKFYRRQAEANTQFTPISQFGIGILSCFMIGSKIEITTKMRGGEHITCSINGPHEHFYYKKTSRFDSEAIKTSGTIIRILLDNSDLINDNINKWQLPLFLDELPHHIPNKERYETLFEQYKKHLHKVLSNFIGITPKNIKVFIKQADTTLLPIQSQPFSLAQSVFNNPLSKDDYELINNHINRWSRDEENLKDIDILIQKEKVYEIEIEEEGVSFHTLIFLPTDIDYKDYDFSAIPNVYRGHLCVDGVFVESSSIRASSKHYYSEHLTLNGILNFHGSLRPQLSVDRLSITNYPKECEPIAEKLSVRLLHEVVEIVTIHIKEYKISASSNLYALVWEYIFMKINFAPTLFVNHIANTHFGKIEWLPFNIILKENDISIKEFVDKDEIHLLNYNFFKENKFTQSLLLTKIISAENIKVTDAHIQIQSKDFGKAPWKDKFRDHLDSIYLVKPNSWSVENPQYDIISNKYPIVSPSFFNCLHVNESRAITKKVKKISGYSNNSSAIFRQDPVLIHPQYGLYNSETVLGTRRESYVNHFHSKIGQFYCSELNPFGHHNPKVNIIVIFAYIAPRKLTQLEEIEIAQLQPEYSDYVRGIKEGWSILVTGQKKDDVIIHVGKTARETLIDKISDEFWEMYSDYTFKFTDGTTMNQNRK